MAEKKVKEIKATEDKKAGTSAATGAPVAVVATATTFDILRRPIISEKSAKLAEANGLAFEVAPKATKKDVAKAVKAIYNVAPAKVNIVVQKGKTKTFRGKSTGTQKTVKKAYITLKAGEKIEIVNAGA